MTRVALNVLLVAVLAVAGCNRDDSALVRSTAGNPRAGKGAIRKYGCETCHAIPGIGAPRGAVGPPLDGIGNRSFLAGRMMNTPQNMMRWIQHPRSVDPRTLMPEMGVTDTDARNITAYLYSLR